VIAKRDVCARKGYSREFPWEELSSNVSGAGAYQGCRSSRRAREDWKSMARIMGVKGVMVMAF
jgi:hypothetical protein